METQQTVSILLAEDCAPDAYLFEESLRRAGMIVEIDHCKDGEECIRKIGSYPPAHPPDLCVIDLHLPHVDSNVRLEPECSVAIIDRTRSCDPARSHLSLCDGSDAGAGGGKDRRTHRGQHWT